MQWSFAHCSTIEKFTNPYKSNSLFLTDSGMGGGVFVG